MVSVNAKAHMRVQSVQVSFLFNLLIFFTLFLQLLNGDLEFGTLKKTLTGHIDSVYALTTLSNGDLVSGSWDNTIKIWNGNDLSLKKTLTGHTDAVRALTTLSNGYLVSGSGDNTIKIWSV